MSSPAGEVLHANPALANGHLAAVLQACGSRGVKALSMFGTDRRHRSASQEQMSVATTSKPSTCTLHQAMATPKNKSRKLNNHFLHCLSALVCRNTPHLQVVLELNLRRRLLGCMMLQLRQSPHRHLHLCRQHCKPECPYIDLQQEDRSEPGLD